MQSIRSFTIHVILFNNGWKYTLIIQPKKGTIGHLFSALVLTYTYKFGKKMQKLHLASNFHDHLWHLGWGEASLSECQRQSTKFYLPWWVLAGVTIDFKTYILLLKKCGIGEVLIGWVGRPQFSVVKKEVNAPEFTGSVRYAVRQPLQMHAKMIWADIAFT